jgi:acetyltransferase-like isoleucine patch superfamily enzyme
VRAVAHEPTFREQLTIGPGCSIGPNAVIYYDTEIGADVLVGDGASIREQCRMGSSCVIGRLVTVDRDVRVGDRTRVMDKAFLTAGMRIGTDVFIAAAVISANDNTFGKSGLQEDVKGPTVEDEALIGGGASLLPGVVIGRAAIVGSGAVVTRDAEPETLVLGVPARPVERDS